MFETAIRAASGRTVDEHRAHLGRLYSALSQVAARNPYAWIREAKTAEEITTVTDDNRMIGLPYPKLMNSNNQVDMGAALIMCSVEAARRLGVAEDRWVFAHAGTDCHEHTFISHRETFARTPAIEIGGRLALELAGIDIDDVSIIDLYSCFPAAVQLGAQSLGIDLHRQWSRTGGMTFAGGPWNNYVMHAIATVVTELRERPGEFGLVWGNGGYATKHSFGVYSTTPTPNFRHDKPQARIDALPRRDLALPADAAGPATIEAYTVMFSRDAVARAGDRVVPAGRRSTRLGHVERPRARHRDVRGRMGRRRGHALRRRHPPRHLTAPPSPPERATRPRHPRVGQPSMLSLPARMPWSGHVAAM